MYIFPIKQIPDPADRTLAASCGGDVQKYAFTASEQLLRMLSGFPAESVTAAIRLIFTPAKDVQTRLSMQMALVSSLPNSEDLVQRLIFAGPYAGIYFDNTAVSEGMTKQEKWQFGNSWRYCSEIVRREEGLESDRERRAANSAIPTIYYSIFPFEVREDNDWLSVDRLLDRFHRPCAVEIIISPTDLYYERKIHYEYITQLMQVNQYGNDLDPHAQSLGTSDDLDFSLQQKVRDPMADEVLREHEDFHKTLREPHFGFNLRCWAETEDDLKLLSGIVAESSFSKGKYRIVDFDSSHKWWNNVHASSEELKVDYSVMCPGVWDTIYRDEERVGLREFSRLAHLASVDELKSTFRLPLGNPVSSPRTVRRKTDPKPLKNKRRSILFGDDLELGLPPQRAYPDDLEPVFTGEAGEYPELRLESELCKKHIFIAGVPGSGKTTAMFNILAQLAHLDEPVPFLVIEPAKTEYRTLKLLQNHPDKVIRKLARDLKVYTVGNETISPFRFNPLAYPEGVSLDEHIGAVLSCFEAAMPMGGPLQGLLAESVEEVYENPPAGQKFPRLKDVLAVARRIVETKGYEGEVLGNLRAALDVRLGLLVRRSLGKVFDCDEGIPVGEELFNGNVILEMDYLTPEHACLMSLFVLTSMREHIRVNRRSGSPLKHVTVLEEAHNIVGRAGDAKASEDTADPKAFAAQYVSRMLAEMRALGEGLIIADQLPSAVAPEVIKNTGTKLVYRLVANDDREDIGGTMLLDGAGMEELARLQPGEGYFYNEGLYRPRRMRALGSHVYLALGQKTDGDKEPQIPQPPDRDELVKLLSKEDWYRQGRNRRKKMELNDVKIAAEEFSDDIASAESLLDQCRALMPQLLDGKKDDTFNDVVARVNSLTDVLDDRVNAIEKKANPVTNVLEFNDYDEDIIQEMKTLRDELGTELIPKAIEYRNNLTDYVNKFKEYI